MSSELIQRALMQPTLLDALAFVCDWDTDRAVKQALNNSTPGKERIGTHHDGALYDTCTRLLIKEVTTAWLKKYDTRNIVLLAMTEVSIDTVSVRWDTAKNPPQWINKHGNPMKPIKDNFFAGFYKGDELIQVIVTKDEDSISIFDNEALEAITLNENEYIIMQRHEVEQVLPKYL